MSRRSQLRPDMIARRYLMASMRAEGATLAAIARRFGICNENVRQTLHRHAIWIARTRKPSSLRVVPD